MNTNSVKKTRVWTWVWITLSLIVLALAGITGYWLGIHSVALSPTSAEHSGDASEGSREVLYWYDPMVPQQHFDQPGKSPFMDMALLPRYAEPADTDPSPGIRIDPRTLQNLGIVVAPVSYGQPELSVSAVAKIAYNERDSAIVQARTNGFVEQVYHLAPGDVVAPGTPLVDILVPTWTGAQKEFLTILATDDSALASAARERLQLLGMPEGIINSVEKTGVVRPVFTVTAPFKGVLETLEVRPGMSVMNGATLARINGLESVWLDAAVAQSELGDIAIGAPVVARIASFPGTQIHGKVVDILPSLDRASRTVTVRALLPNPQGQLRPGQYAQLRIAATTQSAQLLVPTQAVIRGIGSDRVILAENGYFRPVAVSVGRDYGEQSAILSGLEEGQNVVVSGQFLIDSEANLAGALANMVGNTGEETQALPEMKKMAPAGDQP